MINALCDRVMMAGYVAGKRVIGAPEVRNGVVRHGDCRMSLIQEALKRKDDENSGIPPKVIPIIAPTARELPVKRPEVFRPSLQRRAGQGKDSPHMAGPL